MRKNQNCLVNIQLTMPSFCHQIINVLGPIKTAPNPGTRHKKPYKSHAMLRREVNNSVGLHRVKCKKSNGPSRPLLCGVDTVTVFDVSE